MDESGLGSLAVMWQLDMVRPEYGVQVWVWPKMGMPT